MKARFLELDSVLKRYEALWKPSAFTNSADPRLDNYPQLRSWLDTLSNEEIEQLQLCDQQLLHSAQDFFVDAQRLNELIKVPELSHEQDIELPAFWEKDIPGRKAQQIKSFALALLPGKLPLTEWCCGKLHLGRLAAELSTQDLTGLEIKPNLVKQAKSLSCKRKLSTSVTVHQCDVLQDDILPLIPPKQHLIALHACGGLHIKMLKHGSQNCSPRMTLAPCCYHRFNSTRRYQALSKLGQNSQLHLTNEDLRLATRQCNIASAAETRKRKQLQAWRLGFDSLQREVRQVDEYLACPSLSVTSLHQGFESFCRKMAGIKRITLPESLDYEYYEQLGNQRFHAYERFEFIRMLFRRALEVWLVLERALFLEESGYHCTISEFCPSTVSPRNLLIDAYKKPI